MDFFTKQEINGYKGDRILIEESLEADKYAFKRKLEGSFGKKMMEQLNNPPKRSIWVGIKYKYLRWKTIRKCKREERKLKKGGF